MSASWKEVFGGNGEPTELAGRFMAKCDRWLVRGPEFEVGRVDPRALMATFRRNARTAGGPDGWLPEELLA
eukprot:5546265-Alexandrium_andersonii.AAC.1